MKNNYNKALTLVKEEFKNIVDKSGVPYINHLKTVSNDVKKYGELYMTVGLLHDIIEDIKGWNVKKLQEEFGYETAFYVRVLTKKRGEEYEKYIKEIAKYKASTIVKLADLKHNMDINRLTDVTNKDIERIKKYNWAYSFLSSKLQLKQKS